jgi:hypothetical protein
MTRHHTQIRWEEFRIHRWDKGLEIFWALSRGRGVRQWRQFLIRYDTNYSDCRLFPSQPVSGSFECSILPVLPLLPIRILLEFIVRFNAITHFLPPLTGADSWDNRLSRSFGPRCTGGQEVDTLGAETGWGGSRGWAIFERKCKIIARECQIRR